MNVQSTNSVAEMKDLAAPSDTWLTGFATAGDGGGGLFRWEAGSTTPADDVTIVASSKAAGRFKRVLEPILPIEAICGSSTDLSANAGTTTKKVLQYATEIAAGRLVRLSPGVSYTIASTITLSGHVRIQASGAKITQTFGSSGASVVGIIATGWLSTAQAISAISADRQEITLSATPINLGVGSTAKVISDDHQAGARAPGTDTSYRQGEVVIVTGKGGSKLALQAPLEAIYSTAPRIIPYLASVFELDGGEWNAQAGHDGGADPWKSELWRIIGYNKPRLSGVKSTKNYSKGFSIISCVDTLVEAPQISGYSNNDENNADQLGYGIVDISSEGTSITSGRFGKSRHAVTTAMNPTTASTNTGNPPKIEYYGPTRRLDVDAQGVGGAQATLDTHEGSQDCNLRLMASEQARIDTTPGAGICVDIRGFRHRVLDPKGRNGRVGVQVWTDTSNMGTDVEDFTSGIIVENADISRQSEVGLQVRNARDTIIRGGRYASLSSRVAYFEGTSVLQYSTVPQRVIIDGTVTLVGAGSMPSGECVVFVKDTILQLNGTLIIDATQITNGSYDGNILMLSGAAASVVGSGQIVVYLPTGSAFANLVSDVTTGSVGSVTVNAVKYSGNSITFPLPSARLSLRTALTSGSYTIMVNGQPLVVYVSGATGDVQQGSNRNITADRIATFITNNGATYKAGATHGAGQTYLTVTPLQAIGAAVVEAPVVTADPTYVGASLALGSVRQFLA